MPFIKLFKEIEREAIHSKSFLEASITTIPKPEKDPANKENYKPVSLKNTDMKISQ